MLTMWYMGYLFSRGDINVAIKAVRSFLAGYNSRSRAIYR
jgi:hypothetical protein